MSQKNNLKQLLAQYSEMVDFEKESIIFDYQDSADNIYFILSGLVRVYIKNDKNEIEVQRLKNGEFVGESAFTASKFTAKAVSYLKTKALKFTPEDLRLIMQQNKSFANKMINNLCYYIEKLENYHEIQLPSINEIDKKIKAEKEIRNTLAADSKIKKEKAVKKAVKNINSNNNLYLINKSFDQKAEKDYQYFLYNKEIECPVCSTEFEVKKIRNSRLRIKDIREDLRPIYKKFKLYYYNIWSCPNCKFTARKNDFNDFTKSKRKKIKNNFHKLVAKEFGKDFDIIYNRPRNINQVIDAHYLAFKMYNFLDYDSEKIAYLWRELSWIYEDLEEEETAEKASQNALKYLQEFYFKDSNNKSKNETDNLSLLLAVLFYKHGQKDKALPLLDDLIRDSRVNLRQKNKARDLFLKIREENKNNK